MTTNLEEAIADIPPPLSNDELMLKELERRDGIYSFIFHELETAKEHYDEAIAPVKMEEEQSADMEPKRESESESGSGSRPEPEVKDEMVSSAVTSTTSYTTAGLSFHQQSTATLLFGQPYHQLRYHHQQPHNRNHSQHNQHNDNQQNPQQQSQPDYFGSQSQHRHPPAMFTTYFATGSFGAGAVRLRVTNSIRSPQLGAGVPLVRNRVHHLKDSAEYKRASKIYESGTRVDGNFFLKPDLRALFPYDPDVHAPFREAEQLNDSGGGVASGSGGSGGVAGGVGAGTGAGGIRIGASTCGSAVAALGASAGSKTEHSGLQRISAGGAEVKKF